jgi:hypothetical protein
MPAILLFLALAGLACSSGPEPTFEEMEIRFSSERSAYARVKGLAIGDTGEHGPLSFTQDGRVSGGGSFAKDGTWRERSVNVGSERIAQYTSYLDRIGGHMIFTAKEGARVQIVVWYITYGPLGGAEKGYLWLATEEAERDLRKSRRYTLLELTDGWYIYEKEQ